MLKEIAPNISRITAIYDPTNPGISRWIDQFGIAAPSLGVDLSVVPARNSGDIERSIETLAHTPNGGLFVASNAATNRDLSLILSLTGQHRIPAIGANRYFTAGGGLISYSLDDFDQFRGAATYVDRILKGEKPGDLPVQYPTKYQLAVNLKTAKALGLTVPPTLLAIADEVIE